jgi:predicted ribosomally synthesized peptide with SipW-like signal peptide
MNKRILISLSVIGVVVAIAIGGTVAYFSDTETSTGNTFTAGSLDLTIDNECYYNGQTVTECTWTLSDLDDKVFFNFTDLKPGDLGEDTVSLHVTNDAWACVTFKEIVSLDNTCTEPEGKDENTPSAGQCEDPGELDDELYFFFWADVCDERGATPGDNIFQRNCDVQLMEGLASTLGTGPVTYALADADENNVGGNVGEPLYKSIPSYYIGKVWCYGQLAALATPTGAQFTCNGQPVGNESQTDSLSGAIEFYAEQYRNNPNFQCVQ